MPEDASPTPEPVKKKRVPKTLVIVAGVAIGEAALFFGAIKIFGGGPQTTYGDEGPHLSQGKEDQANSGRAEVLIIKKFRVPNSETGRTFIYDFDVSVVVVASQQEHVQQLVEDRGGQICDRLNQVVRAADPRDLDEPDLETIKQKFKAAIGEILGNDTVIHEVLIPRWVPMHAG